MLKNSSIAVLIATALMAASSAHAAPPAGYPVLTPLELLGMNEHEARMAAVAKIENLADHFEETFAQEAFEAGLRAKLETIEGSEAFRLCLMRPRFLVGKKQRAEACKSALSATRDIESELILRGSQLTVPILELNFVNFDETVLSFDLIERALALKKEGKIDEARAWELAHDRQSLISDWVSDYIRDLTWNGPISRGITLRNDLLATSMQVCGADAKSNAERAHLLACRGDALNRVLNTTGIDLTAQILAEIDRITADYRKRILQEQ